VNIFKPGRFSVTLFEAKPSLLGDSELSFIELAKEAKATMIRSAKMEKIKGYRRVDRIVHEFDGYDVVFRYYEREGWEGCAPRLGEID